MSQTSIESSSTAVSDTAPPVGAMSGSSRKYTDAPQTRRDRGRAGNGDRDTRAALRQQLQALGETNRRLDEDKAALENQISALRNTNATLSQAQATQTDRISALEADKETLLQDNVSLKETMQARQEELDTARQDVTTLRDENAVLLHDKSILEQRNQDLENIQQSLRQENKAIVQEKDVLETDNRALAQNKAELENRCNELQDSYDRVCAENTRLRAAFDAQLEKTRAKTVENETLSTNIAGLEEQVSVADAAKREAEAAVQIAQAENEKLAGVIEERQRELEQVRSRVEELVSRNTLLTTENARLRAEKEALELEITPLQTKNDELAEQNSVFQDRIVGLESDNKKLDAALQAARAKVERQEETTYAAINDLGKATGERDAMKLELSKEKHSRKALLASLRDEKAKSSNLETDLSIAHAQLSDTQTTNTQLTQTEVALRNKISQMQNAITALNETADNFKTVERDLQSEISTLQAHLKTRDGQKKDLRAALKGVQKSLSESADRIATLESEAIARDHKVDSLRHRLEEEKRLRSGVTRDLRAQRVKQKELEAAIDNLQETSGERIAEATRQATAASDRAEDLENEIRTTKTAMTTLKTRLNDAKLELIKRDRRLAAEQEKQRATRCDLDEANRMIDELDPEKLHRQLSDEKAARAADVARLLEDMANERARLTTTRLAADREVEHDNMNRVNRVVEETATDTHENCVDRAQVKVVVKMITELISQCDVRPKVAQKYEYQYPQDLVRRADDDKWEIKFVKRCAVKTVKRWSGWP